MQVETTPGAVARALDPAMVVDCMLPVSVVDGRIKPDHGYALYSALSWVVPELKTHDNVQLGRIVDGHVMLRCPVAMLDAVAMIEGVLIRVDKAQLGIGTPWLRPLRPRCELSAPLVVLRSTSHTTGKGPSKYRNGRTDATFGLALAKKLGAIDVDIGKARIGKQGSIKIGSRGVNNGRAVRLVDLTDAESLAVQRAGIGAKRRMGCGVFW